MSIEDGPGATPIPSEEAGGESLDQKLSEEIPDIEIEDQPDIPVAIAPDDALSEEVVDAVIDEDGPEVIPDIDESIE